MARPKLLGPGIGGAGGNPDPGEVGRRAWGWGRLLPGPAGTQGCCLTSIFQHLPWVVAASPQSISAKELFLGTFSYSVHLGLVQREEALERSSLSLEVPSLKERGPENQTDSFSPHPTPPGHQPPTHWVPANSPAPTPTPSCRIPGCTPGPASSRIQGLHPFPLGQGRRGRGRW